MEESPAVPEPDKPKRKWKLKAFLGVIFLAAGALIAMDMGFVSSSDYYGPSA